MIRGRVTTGSKEGKACMRQLELKKVKREEAKARNDGWASLSPAEQLADLDRRLGQGVGARKQRAKTAAKLEAAKVPVKGEKVPKA